MGESNGESIDWGAVFEGLATHDGAVITDVRDGGLASNVEGTLWDNIFPPSLPARGAASTGTTPRLSSTGVGSARPADRSTYPYSAPISPSHQTQQDNDEMFRQLAQSMFGPQQVGTVIPGSAVAGASRDSQAGFDVPPPFAGTSAAQDLEARLKRGNQMGGNNLWHGTANHFSFPHLPSQTQHAFPPPPQIGSSSTRSSWTNPGPSFHPSTSSGDSTPQLPETPLGDNTPGSLDTEDKRQRNTLASAKFRAKRKKQVETTSKRISELENEHTTLTKDVSELRTENRFLREMVEMKYGLDVGGDSKAGAADDDETDRIKQYQHRGGR